MTDRPGFDPERDQVLDTPGLRALTHPLRLELLGLLRTGGPSTATKLATQTGRSSGLTSYHLRQLAQAGLVVDADGTGGGRERWWRAAARSHHFDSAGADPELTEAYERSVVQRVAAAAEHWVAQERTWPVEWRRTADLSDYLLDLTLEQAVALRQELAELAARYRREGTGPHRVSLQVQLFPRGEPPS